MKDDLRYTPSDCFETFPFPPGDRDTAPALEAAGRTYHEFRAALMVADERGPDQDLQPLPRPDERARRHRPTARVARRDGPRRPRAYGWTDLSRRALKPQFLDREPPEDDPPRLI